VLEEHGWTRAELAQRLAFSPKHVNELLKGRAPITADTAERLERVLGHDAGFWLRLEANYQQDLVRLQQLDALASQKDWLKELPLRWLQRQGWVEACSHKGQQVAACLKYFAVASVDAWRQRYGQPLAVYRTSKSFATEQGALASWLRRSETQAGAIPCRPYDAKAFRAALSEMRSLSCEADPSVFAPKLQSPGEWGHPVVEPRSRLDRAEPAPQDQRPPLVHPVPRGWPHPQAWQEGHLR
jgi:HTH-type transcriptional regulator/antitoxin HigA